jgi:hypothetical protein
LTPVEEDLVILKGPVVNPDQVNAGEVLIRKRNDGEVTLCEDLDGNERTVSTEVIVSAFSG